MASDRTHIVIAESSPVLAAGLSHCLQRLPGIQARVIEVGTEADLLQCLASSHAEILLADPAFAGGFNPQKLRESINPALSDDIKIAAVEVGKIDRATASLYDQVVNIVDDIDTIASKIGALASEDSSAQPENDRNTLSNREKEIVTLVVQGLTNKEIAEKLYLSVHTVITHRRNIARKLEIHSPTGLTIYAIVNHLVDISSIQL